MTVTTHDDTALSYLDRQIAEKDTEIRSLEGMLDLHSKKVRVYDVQVDQPGMRPMKGAHRSWYELKQEKGAGGKTTLLSHASTHRNAAYDTVNLCSCEYLSEAEIATWHVLTIKDKLTIAQWVKDPLLPEVDYKTGGIAVWPAIDKSTGRPHASAGQQIVMHRLQKIVFIEAKGLSNIITQMMAVNRAGSSLWAARKEQATIDSIAEPEGVDKDDPFDD